MKRVLSVSILALLAVAPLGAGAQTAGGMSAMQYYVGKWNCMGGPTTAPAIPATIVYAYDTGNSVMRSTLDVPPATNFPGFNSTGALTWDAKNNWYVQFGLDSAGNWSVSHAPAPTGNKESWTDVATNDNKLGRSEAIRTDQNNYTYIGYESANATAPNFKATCKRVM